MLFTQTNQLEFQLTNLLLLIHFPLLLQFSSQLSLILIEVVKYAAKVCKKITDYGQVRILSRTINRNGSAVLWHQKMTPNTLKDFQQASEELINFE